MPQSLFVVTVDAPIAIHVAIQQICEVEELIPDRVTVFHSLHQQNSTFVEFIFVGAHRAEVVLGFFHVVNSFTDRIIVERIELL